MNDEWISARAVTRIMLRNCETELRRYLLKGLVKARSRAATLTSFNGVRTEERDWIVPIETWNGNRENSVFELFNDRYQTHARETGYRVIELVGLTFNKVDLEQAFDRSFSGPADWSGSVVSANADKEVKARSGGPGKPVDSERWADAAAAFAVLAERGELDLASESRAHKSVSTFLAERGRDDALEIDALRPAIKRLRAWIKGHSFPGDADYDG